MGNEEYNDYFEYRKQQNRAKMLKPYTFKGSVFALYFV